MTATFYIPAVPAWRNVLMWAFRNAHAGDRIHVADRSQFIAAGHIIHDFPGVAVTVGEVERCGCEIDYTAPENRNL